MNQYVLVILISGLASLGMAFMPAFTKRTGISYAILFIGVGAAIYSLFGNRLPSALPYANNALVMHLTELIVIISLMGTGIKIDRSFSFANWSTPLRLIGIAMLICIGICVWMGMMILQLALPVALLLGAVLAPTDAVLASDVQVGPPNEKLKSETRFALTSEAGLNDGMAFPFVWLAIVLSATGFAGEGIWNWFGYHLVFKIIAGLLLGWGFGKLAGYLVFGLAQRHRLLKPTDGFVAISLMLSAYGATELLHGYGFVAVFVAGITLRHSEKKHDYHTELHSFTDQIERLLLGILLIFFGGALVSGILASLTWQMVLYVVVFLIIVRPASVFVSLLGTEVHWKEKMAIGFFGIRGMGSVYYLAFAFGEFAFAGAKALWAIVAFTILLSVVMHGLTATRVIKHLRLSLPKEPVPQ